MSLLYCIFFGAGVAGFAYGRLGQRLGYGNRQALTIAVGAIFVISTAFFYTIVRFFLNPQ
jgi:hypothetical protein